MTSTVERSSSILEKYWNAIENEISKDPSSLRNKERLKSLIKKVVGVQDIIESSNRYVARFEIKEGDISYNCAIVCSCKERRPKKVRFFLDTEPLYCENSSFLRWDNQTTNWDRLKQLAMCPLDMSLLSREFPQGEVSLMARGYNTASLKEITKEKPSISNFSQIFLYLREGLLESGSLSFPSCILGDKIGFFEGAIQESSNTERLMSGQGIIWDRNNYRVDEEALQSLEPDSYPEIFSGKKPRELVRFPVLKRGGYEVIISGYLFPNKISDLFSIESVFVYLKNRYSTQEGLRPSLWKGSRTKIRIEPGKTVIQFSKVNCKGKEVSVTASVEPLEAVSSSFDSTGLCWDVRTSRITKEPFQGSEKDCVLLQFYVGHMKIIVSTLST